MANLIRRRTRVHLFIDKSGSMSRHAASVKQGHADFIQSLCEVEASSPRVSCTMFDDDAERAYTDVLPVMVPPFDYQPEGGTHLYDAVGRGVREEEQAHVAGDKQVIVVMTDGHDEGSREWSLSAVQKLVKRLEATGDWTFLFFGDNLGVGTSMGFKAERVYPFLTGAKGIKGVFEEVTREVVGLLTS